MGVIRAIRCVLDGLSARRGIHASFDVDTAFRRLFLFTEPTTTEIYPLSLHDALPICDSGRAIPRHRTATGFADDTLPRRRCGGRGGDGRATDRAADQRRR